MKRIKKNIWFIIFAFLSIIGVYFTLVYIFKTSTAILNADSVLVDIISHLQGEYGSLLIKNFWYSGDFWLISLNIITMPLSFIIDNPLLVRKIAILITNIGFFYILYFYIKKLTNKKNFITFFAVISSGISYAYLDFFYAYNGYQLIVINSLILLLLFYYIFNTENKIVFILAIATLLILLIGSNKYIPMVIIPLIITVFIFIFIKNKDAENISEIVTNSKTKLLIILVVFITTLIGFFSYKTLSNNYSVTKKAKESNYITTSSENLGSRNETIVNMMFYIFGYDNQNNPLASQTNNTYFANNTEYFSVLSLKGIAVFTRLLVSIFVLIIIPILLIKNFKKLDKTVKNLFIFNSISWVIMIYLYIFIDNHHAITYDVKNFLFNIIISLILSFYYIYKFAIVRPLNKFIINLFLVLYVCSNLYITCEIIHKNNHNISLKTSIVDFLKKNNLDFGYASYWDANLIYFLSDYKIEIAPVYYYYDNVEAYKHNTLDSIHTKDYHNRKTFIMFNSNHDEIVDWNRYFELYGKPVNILKHNNYNIWVYYKNPFNDHFKNNKNIYIQ